MYAKPNLHEKKSPITEVHFVNIFFHVNAIQHLSIIAIFTCL